MSNLSSKDLEVLSSLLASEGMACKKAKVYAKTLTDPTLAECMSGIAQCHEKRFNTLLQILAGT